MPLNRSWLIDALESLLAERYHLNRSSLKDALESLLAERYPLNHSWLEVLDFAIKVSTQRAFQGTAVHNKSKESQNKAAQVTEVQMVGK